MTSTRRPFWQFHLSTLLAMVMAAAVFLFLNIRARERWYPAVEYLVDFPTSEAGAPTAPDPTDEGRQYLRFQSFGWPLDYRHKGARLSKQGRAWKTEPFDTLKDLLSEVDLEKRKRRPEHVSTGTEKGQDIFQYDVIPSWWPLLWNILISVGCILGMALCLEMIARRKGRRGLGVLRHDAAVRPHSRS